MKHRWIVLSLLAFLVGPAFAGVVYEIETTDHEQSPPKTETMEAMVEGMNLKMGVTSGRKGAQGDMIYRGDRREMVVVDHEDRSYTVMDQETLKQVAGQVSQAMSQLQEALKNVPEGQREMVEKMMKERMPAQAAPQRPKSELKKTGERAEKNGYPCVKYDVLRGGKKLRELWVTDWSNVEGGDEVAGAFEEMAGFFQEMLDALPDFGQQGADDTMFEHMKELGGFPVVTREFDDDGSLEAESTLRSSSRRTLDPADFEPPAGYKRRSMGPGG